METPSHEHSHEHQHHAAHAPEQAPTPSSKNATLLGVLGVALVAAVAFFTQSGNKQSPAASSSVPVTNYKNGTYDMEGDYRSPAGPESIDVNITLTNNVITDAVVTVTASNPKSVKFQGMFVEGFKSLVVGKNIDDVQLDKVSGSSLTPKGFNDALAKIKAAAKI